MIILMDLSSMYPSIRKALGITTRKDELGVYPQICNLLNDKRYEYKYKARDLFAEGQDEKAKKYDAIQNSLKVFSNTGNYGWLVNQWGKFNDYEAGATITRWGRRIIKKVNEGIESFGGTVLRTDTDGSICIVPECYRGSKESEQKFVQKVEQYLNDWFTAEADTDQTLVLEHDARAKAIILFDDKSYVLENYDGTKKIKGNTLTGRSNEKFMLEFVSNGIDHILAKEPQKIKRDYDYWKFRIEQKLMTVDLVQKRQSLNMSLEDYQHKRTSDTYSAIAQYEAALSADKPYQKGDVIHTWNEEPEPIIKEYKTVPNKQVIPNASSYEVIRLAKNFNGNIYRDHYHGRLEKAAKKFLVVLGWEKFSEMFPDMNLNKPCKEKMLGVWEFDRFVNTFPDFSYREKHQKDLDIDLLNSYLQSGRIKQENIHFNLG